MSSLRLGSVLFLVLLPLFAVQPAAGSSPPVPVSPGTPDRATSTASPCPTFSWGAVDGDTASELVLYEFADDALATSGEREIDAAPLLHTEIRCAAFAWTPPNGACLDVSRVYVWSRSTTESRF